MTLAPVACSFEISPINGRIQLFPFGRFYPADGRTDGAGGWYVDDSNGYQLAEQINGAKVKLMIDYEHQSLFLRENGKGNPAAGWIERVEYISGEGLFADVIWTEDSSAEIKGKKYRYISPWFFAAADGRVVEVLNAALTNRPALHELAEAYAASYQFTHQHINQQQKGKNMLKLLQQLFGLPSATEAEITDKLNALSESKADSAIALSDVYTTLKTNDEKLVALSAQTGVNQPDPTKYVALSDMKQVQDELTKLKAEITSGKVEQLISVALSDGRLLPSQKAWAENLGKANLVALSDYLAVAVPNAALNGVQSGGEDPNKGKAVALSSEDEKAAKMLGLSEAEYRANIKLVKGEV